MTGTGTVDDELGETLAAFGGPRAAREPLTTREVAEDLDCSRRTAYNRLDRLADRGLVGTKKVGAKGRVWWPLPDGRADDDGGRAAVGGERAADADARTGPDDGGAGDDEEADSAGDDEEADSTGDDEEADSAGDDEEADSAGDDEEAGPAGDDGEGGDERELLERVLETSPVGIAVYESDGTPGRMNGEMAELLGVEADGDHDYSLGDLELCDEDGDPIPYAELPAVRAVGTGEPVTDEVVRTDDDAGTSWYSVNALPLGGDGDRVVTTAADITRVTEQAHRLERQRDELETELDELFGRIGDGFYALDEDWRFTFLNERARWGAREYGTIDGDPVGAHIWEGFPHLAGTAVEEAYREAVESGEQRSIEYYNEEAGVWFEVRAYPSASGLSVYFQDVTERKERERELERRREQLEAVNNLHEVVAEINEALAGTSTREDVEALVCERLAASDSYEFAWFGEVDRARGEMVLRTEAGVEGYLDDVTIAVDEDGSQHAGPNSRAVHTGRMQAVQDAREEYPVEAWREHAREYEYRSSAAIPITHENTLYGVLNVYSERPDAFDGEEGTVVGRLGEVVGHAIAAVERKRALMTDEVVELTFEIPEFLDVLQLSGDGDERIELERTVPVGDGDYLEYGTATDGGLAVVRSLVDRLDHWESVRVVEDSGDRARFEARLSEPPVVEAVAANAGRIVEATIRDGDYRMTVQLPTGVDVRRVIDAVTTEYPAATAVSRRQVPRPGPSPESLRRVLIDELTDRQRSALEAAYFAGFYEWPRDTTNERLASSMGVSSPTFSHHLRKAERQMFDALLADDAHDGRPGSR